MNLIYNSAHYWILAYPALQSYELFDKETLSIAYLQGPYAEHFAQVIEEIADETPDEESMDAFLDDYCEGVAHPIVFH